MSTTEQPSFGGADADLAARLAAPVSPTTEKASAEARRRTSEWKPPTAATPAAPQRAFSFDHEEHKRHMMLASASASGGPAPAPPAAEGVYELAQGFTERG